MNLSSVTRALFHLKGDILELPLALDSQDRRMARFELSDYLLQLLDGFDGRTVECVD